MRRLEQAKALQNEGNCDTQTTPQKQQKTEKNPRRTVPVSRAPSPHTSPQAPQINGLQQASPSKCVAARDKAPL